MIHVARYVRKSGVVHALICCPRDEVEFWQRTFASVTAVGTINTLPYHLDKLNGPPPDGNNINLPEPPWSGWRTYRAFRVVTARKADDVPSEWLL